MRLSLFTLTAVIAFTASGAAFASESTLKMAGFSTQTRQHQGPEANALGQMQTLGSNAPQDKTDDVQEKLDKTPGRNNALAPGLSSTLQSPRDNASGLPTGKRTHMPVLQGAANPSGPTGSPGGLGSKRGVLSIGPKQDDPAPPPSTSMTGEGNDDGPSTSPGTSPVGTPGGLGKKGLAIGPKQDDPVPPPSSSLGNDNEPGGDDSTLGVGQSPGGLGSKRGALSIGPKQDDPAPPAPSSSKTGDDGDGEGPGPVAVDGVTPNPVDRPAAH